MMHSSVLTSYSLLQDWIKKLVKLKYDKNDLDTLHKLNKTVQVKINT